MEFLHTMIRVKDLEANLDFFCNKLGLVEKSRFESEKGRFTLVYLYAPNDKSAADEKSAPLLELTYNWPDEKGGVETYSVGRGFGHLAYGVKDIYKTCEHLLAEGLVINRPPRDGRMAFVNSPEGISIELLQKGEALELKEPWLSMKNTGSW